MSEKKRIDPIPVAFAILVLVCVSLLIYRALQLGLEKYNEYYRDNNVAYGSDLNFFGTNAIDQHAKPQDSDLRDNALRLLNAHLNDQTAESCGAEIDVNDGFFNMLDPNYNTINKVNGWCCLSAFLVLQKNDKAIVAFEYSVIPESIERAEEYCRDVFKTRALSRMYLERIEGRWTVTDVLVVQ